MSPNTSIQSPWNVTRQMLIVQEEKKRTGGVRVVEAPVLVTSSHPWCQGVCAGVNPSHYMAEGVNYYQMAGVEMLKQHHMWKTGGDEGPRPCYGMVVPL